MLPFSGADVVHLSTALFEGASILTSCAEEKNLCDVSEIETDTTPIASTVFAEFVPDDVGFVLESPSRHYTKSVWKQRVWNPEVEMCSWRQEV